MDRTRLTPAALGFPLVLAAAMAWCAVPAAIADFITLPYLATMGRVKAGETADPVMLAAAADANLRAARWSEADRRTTDAAIAMIADGAHRRDAATVEAVLRDALIAAPADRANWLRLAAVRLRTDRGAARAAWMMAVRAAPFNPAAIGPVVGTGFALLPTDDPAFVAQLVAQVRIAALVDPGALAAVALARHSEPFVYASLLNEPDLSWQFELALAGRARTRNRPTQ